MSVTPVDYTNLLNILYWVFLLKCQTECSSLNFAVWVKSTFSINLFIIFFLVLAAMLATQLNDLVTSKVLEVKAVVQLDKYICNIIQETR